MPLCEVSRFSRDNFVGLLSSGSWRLPRCRRLHDHACHRRRGSQTHSKSSACCAYHDTLSYWHWSTLSWSVRSTAGSSMSGQLLSRLQSVLNAATRLVFSARKSDHVPATLHELHWLQVLERVRFRPGCAFWCTAAFTTPRHFLLFTYKSWKLFTT